MKQCLLPTLLLLGLTAPVLAQTLTFSPAVAYAGGGSGTSGVAVQDLNNDGRPDIVFSNASAAATVGVLLNTGAGTFAATAISYASGATSGNASAVALGDVNADGKTDIVVLNTNDSTVGVLLGTGTGTFSAATTYPVGTSSYPSGLALADVNGDGRADVLVANNLSGTIGVLLSRSAGGLGAATQLAVGSSSPQSLTTGDMNGDGRPDLVVGTSGGGVLVLLGSGTGSFAAAAASYPTGGSSVQRVRVGDVNSDGKLDVVTANTFENSVSVLPGTGTGTLGTAASYSAGNGSAPPSVALGDLNKDGRLDVVSANYGYNTAGVLLNQGAGSFPATAVQFSTGNNSAPNDVAVADVNGDGRADLITANSTTGKVAVLLNASVLAARSAVLAASVQLYPNPAHGSLEVQLPAVGGASFVRVELRTALGQCVQQQTAPLPAAGTRLTIPIEGLAAGLYVLQLQAGDQTLVQRVVVE